MAAGGDTGSGGPNPAALPRENLAPRTPVLSVLGNTTRSYPRLRAVAAGFADALHSPSGRGCLARDVAAGLVPEEDDCAEALEHCRELMEAYEPPRGSGLVAGEDDDPDSYFDDDDEDEDEDF
jgi:hypothetical protein